MEGKDNIIKQQADFLKEKDNKLDEKNDIIKEKENKINESNIMIKNYEDLIKEIENKNKIYLIKSLIDEINLKVFFVTIKKFPVK